MYMEMFSRHNEIRRSVEEIPGGVRTTTESDSPDLAALLQQHVPSMYSHLDQGGEIMCMSQSLPTLFRRAFDYQRQITLTPKGVVAVETSGDPNLTQAIRAHAREVTGFVTEGMPAMMQGMMGGDDGTRRNDGTSTALINHHAGKEIRDAVCDVIADQPLRSMPPMPRSEGSSVSQFRTGCRALVDSGFTSERDHDVDVTNELRINECGCVSCDVDTNLGQGLSGQVVDGSARLGASRVHLHSVASDLAHQPGGHLRLAAVLDADEQDGRLTRRVAHRGSSVGGGDAEFVEQAADPLFDVVTDRTDRVDRLSGGVGQNPFLIAFTGKGRASVAAAHRHDDVGGLDDLVGPRLGELAGDVDADVGHRGDGGGVDLVAGFGPAGPCRGESPARWLKYPRAIWERPALWVHKNSTVGLASVILPSTRAKAVRRCRAQRSASSGRNLEMVALPANWS